MAESSESSNSDLRSDLPQTLEEELQRKRDELLRRQPRLKATDAIFPDIREQEPIPSLPVESRSRVLAPPADVVNPELNVSGEATVTRSPDSGAVVNVNDDALEALRIVLEDQLEVFGHVENQQFILLMLLEDNYAIRKYYNEAVRILEEVEQGVRPGDYEATRNSLHQNTKTIERLLDDDEFELRRSLANELPKDASALIDNLVARRTANARKSSETAIALLEREGVIDPFAEAALRITPSVRNVLENGTEEQINTLQEGRNPEQGADVIERTLEPETREVYFDILEEGQGASEATYFSPQSSVAERGLVPEEAESETIESEEITSVAQAEVDPITRPPGDYVLPETGLEATPSTPDYTNTGGLNPEDHQDVVDAMTSTFGIRAAFWNLDANKLQIGVDRNGGPVPADSEDAVRVQHLLEYLVENKITSDARVLAVVEQSAWYQTTNASMREFDAKYGGLDNFLDLNPENQRDKVGDILDQVEDGFRQLGVQVDEERMIEIAATIDYLGYDMDDVEIATRVLAEAQEVQYQFDAETASFTEFASTKDAVEATARSYYINLPNSAITDYAQKIFTGELPSEQLHSIFREQAQARFGNDQRIQNALQAGMTLESYFAPYAGELEKELGRPVDLFTEFPEVIEQMGSDGVARPMTYAEMRTFARQQPEWSQSTRGQDAAYNMVFEMGKLFGVEA
jgi:hypothetical protein